MCLLPGTPLGAFTCMQSMYQITFITRKNSEYLKPIRRGASPIGCGLVLKAYRFVPWTLLCLPDARVACMSDHVSLVGLQPPCVLIPWMPRVSGTGF